MSAPETPGVAPAVGLGNAGNVGVGVGEPHGFSDNMPGGGVSVGVNGPTPAAY